MLYNILHKIDLIVLLFTLEHKTTQNNTKAMIPERSKGTDLRSVALASWVRIPLRAPVSIAQMVRASVL